MTYVYRLYDDCDQLLYVGVAERFLSRMKQHEATKSWWSDVARIDFRDWGSRRTALETERTHIRTLLPLYNVSERPTDRQVWDFLSDMDGEVSDFPSYVSMYQYQSRLDGGRYCATEHRADIAHDVERLVDERRDHPAFVAQRVADVIRERTLRELREPCDPGCACSMVDA